MSSAGLYVHIPFCASRCGYCHFATSVEAVQEPYVRALLSEIAEVSRDPDATSLSFDSIYFGGGTPSLLPIPLFTTIVDALRRSFRIEHDCEFTIEMNPEPGGNVAGKAAEYAASGVTRVSLGAQSALQDELRMLDRQHTVEDVRRAYRGIRDVIPNVNLDFMLGLPGQDPEKFRTTLDFIGELRPNHVSVYILEIFPGTALSRFEPPDDETVERLYFETCDVLAGLGFEHYEVCNFALPGYRSRHNLKYWDGTPYVGLGLSAASFFGGRRRTNTSNLHAYIEAPARGRAVAALDADTQAREEIFMSLRTSAGLDLDRFQTRHGFDAWNRFRAEWEDLLDRGLLIREGSRFRIPERRMLLGNEVFHRFI